MKTYRPSDVDTPYGLFKRMEIEHDGKKTNTQNHPLLNRFSMRQRMYFKEPLDDVSV